MLHYLKKQFLNLKIRNKVALCMVLLCLACATIVGGLCSWSFSSQFTAQVHAQTDNTHEATIASLQANINNLYRSVTFLVSNPLIGEIYNANRTAERDPNFLKHYNALHLSFTSFLRNAEWVDNIALICANGTLYSTHEAGWNYTPDQFADEMAQTSIVWLPARENPLATGTSQVIPVCFPISYQGGLTFGNGQPADLTLILYLNLDRVSLSMEQMNRAAFSHVYLADASGFPLNMRSANKLYAEVTQPDFCAALLESEGRTRFDTKLNDEPYLITAQPVQVSGLQFVSAVSYQPILSGVRKIQQVTLAVIILTLIAALLLSAALSATITQPIQRLLTQVQKVQRGDYSFAPVTKYEDEMHVMDQALCDMAHTIQVQIEDIRHTEALRRKAEMDALTEQMNPHFLYNTLDCIHWEILSGHQQSAAAMVESLGAFLRLSLNRGRELLCLPDAIAHTEQYVKIINCRFRSDIRFTYTVSPELQNFMLPKMILQPLAENAILHGFGGQNADPAVLSPAINITARTVQNTAVILIEDNGKGFDVQAMQQAFATTPAASGHVGLPNVGQRLHWLFGDAMQIAFTSIPYYRNEIILTLPLETP